MYNLICFSCHQATTENQSVTRCPKCNGPLTVEYDYEAIRKDLNSYNLKHAPPKALKYADFYPIKDNANIISLNEGGTPLYQSKKIAKELGIKELYFKNEGLNPTGAFKDRGSLVEVTKAVELGAKAISMASTGNMAASVSAYCAKAGIDCYIFVPQTTPESKLAQALSFGAKVIKVRGTYSEAAALAEQVAEKFDFYLAGDYCFRQEGQKSQGFEIIEQLNWQVPDYVLVPVGNGTNITAIWKAFLEYEKVGLIEKLPRMIAVQAAGCSPIVKAYKSKSKKDKIEAIKRPDTIAGAISVGAPFDGVKVLQMLKESKGFAIAVDDESILEAEQELASKESTFAEPAAVTPIAALKALKKQKRIAKDATYVCLISGNGLKDPTSALRMVAEPPTIDVDIEDVKKLLKSGILKVRSAGARDREKVVFTSVPTKEAVTDYLGRTFKFTAKDEYLDEIHSQIKRFLQKGKKPAKADIQYIIENVIQNYIPIEKRALKVSDFKIEIQKDRTPLAEIEALLNGKMKKASATGVGPVDAAINALKNCVNGKAGVDFKLTDYKVEINTRGTDASVDVSMDLVNNRTQEKVVGNGTSPDIIQASIDAFVNAYNQLALKE